MKRVICSQLELIHIDNIDIMNKDQIILKPLRKFTKLLLEDNANYTGQSQSSGAGTILNETVTAKIRHRDSIFFYLVLKYYVLRLNSDNGTFIVGSIDYPCEVTYSTDRIFVNLTFKASKPL